MSKKGNRKIRSKTVRNMLTFAHYRFKEFLKHKAQETGKTVVDVCEAYTSKTVSWTGELVNIGGSRIIRVGEFEREKNTPSSKVLKLP
ncbi:zinc ribbon domain-containing protein [Moorena sp. SIO3I6]|uniref:zinc ribbon domain-containing protein n=1 Tax=Moorena sp. SIO3I6 TaxID=2607831 RepID=UPI0025F87DC6|nr:zinc ribbon domain-containing protein [Moorena sp. SIO3I6]